MFKPTKSQNQDLKSAADFAQWLSEINLFAQETQSELHEVAGLLNLALARDHRSDLDVGNRLTASSQGESSTGAAADLNPNSDSESDDSLASLQHKLAKQVNSKRSSPSSPRPENLVGNPNSTVEGVGNLSIRYRDPSFTDPTY